MWKRDGYEKQVQRLVPAESWGASRMACVCAGSSLDADVCAKLLQPQQKEQTHSLVVVGSETSTCGCLRPSWGCDGKSRPSTNRVRVSREPRIRVTGEGAHRCRGAAWRSSHTGEVDASRSGSPPAVAGGGSVGQLCTYQEPFRHFLVWQKQVVVFGHRDVLGISESCWFACLLFKIRKYIFFQLQLAYMIY